MKINGYFILDGEVKSFHVTDPKRGLDYVLFERARPHGEWIFKNGKYRCNACGEKAIYVYPGMSNIPKAILTDFCPKCGVQMNAKVLEMIRKREGE